MSKFNSSEMLSIEELISKYDLKNLNALQILKTQVVETIWQKFNAIDQKNWQDLKKVLAENVNLDYESLTKIAPESFQKDDLIEYWIQRLGKLKSLKHLNSNHEVDLFMQDSSLKAKVYSVVMILYSHPVKNHADYLQVFGAYRHKLEFNFASQEWKINNIKFEYDYRLGNKDIVKHAKQEDN